MTEPATNPFVYIFPLVLLVGFGGYYLYGAIDRWGLALETVDAVVTDKVFTPGGTTYNQVISGGRAWTQANKNEDYYAIQLLVRDEPTVGLVTKDEFERLSKNDRVHATVRRTRISGRLEVVDIKR